MRVAIVDDYKPDREKLHQYVISYFEDLKFNCLSTIALYSNCESFFLDENTNSFDIVFFDIYMDGISGMDAARILRQNNQQAKIIFITSSLDFAIESYDVEASHYVIKPFKYNRLRMVMDRVLSKIEIDQRKLSLPNSKTLPLRELQYIDCFNHLVCLHLTNGKQINYRMNYVDISHQLLQFDDFAECYKGTCVNLSEVNFIKDSKIMMKSGLEIAISRRKLKETRKKYDDLLFSLARKH